MSINPNHILQLTDSVTDRRSVIRIDPADCNLSVESLLDKYLKHADINHLVANQQVPEDSAETLASLQDLVYATGENGQLTNMFLGVEFIQGEEVLSAQDFLTSHPIKINDTHALLIDLVIDRENVGYERNWKSFNCRRWNRHASTFSDFVDSCSQDHTNSQPESDAPERQITFIQSIAMRIWKADFENYSRFTDRKLIYKTGDETVLNIVRGSGGICSEKVQALKFITDHYGLESEIVFAGPDVPQPVPEDDLRDLLSTFDFHGSNKLMRFWQHLALLYHIDGIDLLVDATNGNIPFLFLTNADAERLLGYRDKSPIAVRMTIRTEDFYYHRIAQDIPEKLLFAMEGWIPDVDLVQVFDNELGLYISEDFMVAPVVYRTERAYEHQRQQYLQACTEVHMPCEINHEWNLNSELGQKFISSHENVATKILEAKEHLLRRYNACHGEGHESGLVMIEING
jgi:hypothetical protein